MDLLELRVYQESMKMADEIWNIVIKWDYFAKDTIGKQLVRSSDSIAANLSEGFGRYHYKENLNFCYYSRGSLYETKTWLNKAYNRTLINEIEFEKYDKWIKDVGIKLNNYITSIAKQSKS